MKTEDPSGNWNKEFQQWSGQGGLCGAQIHL